MSNDAAGRRRAGAGGDSESDERPAPIRFTDLAAPVFPAEAQPLLGALAEYGRTLALDPEAMVATAAEQTGLATWGGPAFRGRLDLLCTALRNEAGLSPVGVATHYESLLQLLRNRLLVEDLIARNPDIEQVRIERPIVICGLPRTGTTHLHNLLAADPALRHLPYWESLEPVLPAGERGAGPDPRLARCAAAVDLVDLAMPEFKRMHEMTVDHAHEEIQLLSVDVSSMLFETTALVPSWRDHYRATDQTPTYAYLKRILQVLQWLRGGVRWVLKSPQHLEQFGPLAATFPDATFVVTHRDPVAVTASLCTMVAYSARLATERPDPVALARYWADRTADLLTACEQDRDLLPADQSLDVRFDDFMADEHGTVARIYELAGQPLDRSARDAMAAFRASHPRGRHGTVEYDLGLLGLDAEERRSALRGYDNRFVRRGAGR